MKLLLTSAGISNNSIRNALVEMLGKPIEESTAVFIPTAIYGIVGGGEIIRKVICGTLGDFLRPPGVFSTSPVRGRDPRDLASSIIFQKLQYIHHNPVSKKWNLVSDFTDYEHSSTSFYERGIKKYKNVVHVNDVLAPKLPGSLLSTKP